MHYFDFTDTIHGVTIVSASERLSTASLSPKEIDMQVRELRADLDRIAVEMKAAVAGPRRPGSRTTGNA